MATGNTYGLGEISHFGSFQRVGGKAGGFINKKFFHPSSLRNQEKLWMAMSADERERKKEDELSKRREEERQVEDLRKQMYLSGQGKASDLAAATAADAEAMKKSLSMHEKTEQRQQIDEQKRRRALVKKEHAIKEGLMPSPSPEGSPRASDDDEDDEDGAGAPQAGGTAAVSAERKLAPSRYEEDVYVRGHRAVWGSWYSEDEKQWGFACCQTKEFSVACPLEPEAVEEEPQKGRGGKRRKKKEEEPVPEEPAAPQGGLQGKAGLSSSSAAPRSDAPLIDERMFEAAARRQEKRKLEEMKKEEARKSAYLGDLMADPTAG